MARLSFDRSELSVGNRVCVAVSGGADSVALLMALHAANGLPREGLGVGLTAVHVHHGLRGGEADGDAAFVVELCERLGIRLHLERVSVAGAREETGEGVEEAARRLRYEVFNGLLESGEADVVVTAHTLDDQAETVVMKLLRGAWTEGLSGVHPVVTMPRGKIVRPLLRMERAEVVAFLKELGQDWREDSSNADMGFLRNRVRRDILPMLRKENPSLNRTLGNLAILAREEEARWQVELGRLMPQILLPGKPVRGGGRAVATTPGDMGVAIEIERLRGLDEPARRRVLRAAARSLGSGSGARLSFEETERLLALCGLRVEPTVVARPGTVLALSQGLRAERSVREVRLSMQMVISSKRKG